MERYQQLFSKLTTRNEGAFVPFVILGDPQPALSLQIIDTFIDAGADALELGMPFSDPLSDGPIIQNATLRALAAGIKVEHCFEMLASIRKKYLEIPIGLMMYANLVFNKSIDTFYEKCSEVGVDSVLVADVPIQEIQPFHRAAIRHGVAPILICPPNADNDLLRKIAFYGRSYTYLLSRSGVTGIEKQDHIPLANLVKKLKEYHAAPVLQGFGIAEPSQVRASLLVGTAGAISGSAIIRIIADNVDQPTMLLEKVEQFVRNMKAATHNLLA